MNIKDQIQSQLTELLKFDLYPEERVVLQVIYDATFDKAPTVRITQRQIAQSEPWLGCHPQYDPDLPQKEQETTLRKVRQVIRDLRIDRQAPILSDINGYWIPSSQEEVYEYLKRIESEAKAQARAWFETYGAMSRCFRVSSDYFEGQKTMFAQPAPAPRLTFDATQAQSKTDPDKTYKIIMTPNGPKCFCPGFLYRKTCKHINPPSEN